MRLSIFQNSRDTAPELIHISWQDFLKRCKRPLIRSEKDGKLFSPAIFDPPQRRNENVQLLSAVVLDLDHEVPDLSEIQRRLSTLNCAYAIYSTHSHLRTTESNPLAERRYRVVIPLTQSAPVRIFKNLRTCVIKITGLPADKAASAPAQMFYTPVKADRDAAYEYAFGEGDPLDRGELDWSVLDSELPAQPSSNGAQASYTPDASTILQKAFSSRTGPIIRALYEGDTSEYGNDGSAADLGLCSRLAFYCGRNPSVLDQLFRGSRLFRSKWDVVHNGDGRTYGQMTVDKALSASGESYDWNARNRAVAMTDEAHKPRSTEEWEQPASFYEHDLPSFPVNAFPVWVGEYVAGLARETQTPVDLAAMQTLAVCAGAVAGRVRVQAREGWAEPANLYAVAALLPGNRKSGVFSVVCEPLEELESELVEASRDLIAEAASERRILEERLTRLEKEAARAEDPDERRIKQNEAIMVSQELASAKVPVSPRLICSDVTPEVLASQLAEQSGRMCLLSPEGDLFEMLAGRYTNTPNFDVILKGHCGDPLRVDRRGRSEHVHHPALTIGLCVQPDVIRGLIDKPGFRGRGLLGRFLWSLPVSTLGKRKIAPEPLSQKVRKKYNDSIKALAQLEPAYTPSGEPAPRMLYLTPEADGLLREFEAELEPQLADDGVLGMMTDWAGKLAGAIVRIAGILRLAQEVENLTPFPKVDIESVRRAISIGRYLIPHARAAYAEMGADPQIENAKRVLRWIEKTGQRSFTKRDAHQGNKGRFKKVADIEPALDLLEEHGYIRAVSDQPDRGPGRKPSQVFEVNPYLFSSSHNSHNPHNSPLEATTGTSENCETAEYDISDEAIIRAERLAIEQEALA